LGRLTAVTNALGQVTRYEYNELGEQTTQIDAEGRITRYQYDGRGRRITRILPLGQATLDVGVRALPLRFLTLPAGESHRYQEAPPCLDPRV
jgi:YD repeat-containing protein